jgi:hypothetical protein
VNVRFVPRTYYSIDLFISHLFLPVHVVMHRPAHLLATRVCMNFAATARRAYVCMDFAARRGMFCCACISRERRICEL